tara:strand:- start:410 stop:2428 length:2019 start_codon:yes stop_codon:yes gene_type:complete
MINNRPTRAYYSKSIQHFLEDPVSLILGNLTTKHTHATENLQRYAWINQIEILKNTFMHNAKGHILFEFSIPRMGKRVDNIVIIDDLIFVIEFKVGDDNYHKYALDQVLDYSLDLKNFHQASHEQKIIPILVSTDAHRTATYIHRYEDLLYKPILANKDNLYEVISTCFKEKSDAEIHVLDWENASYKPTPTIIEAAQALYKGHNVREISRSDSGAINLTKTSECINKIIDESRTNSKKTICFITGVPGAGKTLAGLNIATERMKIAKDENAVFLSGNGPLVKVLREALTIDEVKNAKLAGNRITKTAAATKTHGFIQNIHHFRDEGLISSNPPPEKVVVFDEAQRAWTKEQLISWMKQKKGFVNFDRSEPQFLIEVMDRHQDWSTIICLIGGGQEINTGEAGLDEWITALKTYFPNWNIYFSELIAQDNNYLDINSNKEWLTANGTMDTNLHLSVSVRSFRSEKLSHFVECLLRKDAAKANDIYKEILINYPIFVTRDLQLAKNWIQLHSRGSERYGILASSNARRLRPLGIDVKNEIDPSKWFLSDVSDIRSSYYMEDVATEFDIQGLELDWSIVCWGADLHFKFDDWVYQNFKGTKWQIVRKPISQKYLLNAYRVLLTRARQGFIIFIPEGNEKDKTRPCNFYDTTYIYLTQGVGIKSLESNLPKMNPT